MQVCLIIKQYRRNNFQFVISPRSNKHKITISEDMVALIIDRDTLVRQVTMTLKQRVIDLKRRHSITISPYWLRKKYRDHGIRYRRVDVFNIAKAKKKKELMKK